MTPHDESGNSQPGTSTDGSQRAGPAVSEIGDIQVLP